MATETKNVVTIKAKAFAGRGIETVRCVVDDDGTVRVWDRIAGYYTTCHSLDDGAQRRARKRWRDK